MAIKKLTYTDIPSSLRAKAAGEAQRRLQAVLSDPVATSEQRELARRQQGVLRQWASGTLPSEPVTPVDEQTPVEASTPDPEPQLLVDEQTPVAPPESAPDLPVEAPEEP